MNIEDTLNLYIETVEKFDNLANKILDDSEESNKYKYDVLSDISNNIKFIANNIYNLKNTNDVEKLDEYLIPSIYLDTEIYKYLYTAQKENNPTNIQKNIITILNEFKDISDIAAEYYTLKSSYEKNNYYTPDQTDSNNYNKFIDSVKKISANLINLKEKYSNDSNIINILANIEYYIEDIIIL